MNYWDELMGTDEGAASYMESYGEGPGCETRMLLGSFINDGETVLDVGAGPGWNLDHFLKYGPKVGKYKGTDYSERFIRVANERWKLPHADHREIPFMFQVMDARNLQEQSQSWDVVILQDILEHTNGYKIPINEALRVAKKRVIISFWRMNDSQAVDKINDDGNDGYGADYSRKDFEKFLDELELHWVTTETSEKANRWHRFYVIDREIKHGS